MTAKTDTRALVSRCPACGQRVESPDTARCPLCNFNFGDDRITGADVTPYAKAYAKGDPGWWAMCRWVWSAGSERLKHIALMRSSAAAKRFAWINLLWLALGAAAFQATRVGWREVGGAGSVAPGGSNKPVGRGWMHAAGAGPAISPSQTSQTPVDLWWNPAQAMIASAIAGLAALLLMWLLILLIRAGLTLAHTATYRGEQRMAAATLYSTAWCIPALVGIVICLLRPWALVGQMSKGGWHPTNRGLSLIAGIFVGVAVTMWWLWLIRLGGTAPARTRGRVLAFCTLGIPLLLAGGAFTWWVGLDAFHEFLFVRLKMHF